MKQLTRALVLASCVLAMACSSSGSKPPKTPSPEPRVEQLTQAYTGGSIGFADGTRLSIPAGALATDVSVVLDHPASPPPMPSVLAQVGNVINIDLKGQTLQHPATLELPYDPARLPAGMSEDEIFAGYFDDATQQWIPVGGVVDTQRHVVTVQITHASSWGAWTWIADALIQGIVAGFKLDFGTVFNATQAFAGCSDGVLNVIIDESAIKDYLGSCIEGGDAVQAKLRIVNRRTFFTKVTALPGQASSNFVEKLEGLGPLDRQSFTVDFSNAPVSEPFVLKAEPDIPRTLVDSVLQIVLLLPGAKEAIDADAKGKIALIIYKNQHVVAAGLKLEAGDRNGFIEEMQQAFAELPKQILDQVLAQLAKPGSLFSKAAGLISELFKITEAGGVLIQLEDLAASTSKGPGEVKFYSNRPIFPAKSTPAADMNPPPPAPTASFSDGDYRAMALRFLNACLAADAAQVRQLVDASVTSLALCGPVYACTTGRSSFQPCVKLEAKNDVVGLDNPQCTNPSAGEASNGYGRKCYFGLSFSSRPFGTQGAWAPDGCTVAVQQKDRALVVVLQPQEGPNPNGSFCHFFPP